MRFDGVAVGLVVFLSIGIFHPIVIKAEYYFSKSIWPVFLAVGLVAMVIGLFLDNYVVRICLSVFGMCCFWSIHELFEQEKRVKRGLFPDGRKRKK